MASVKADLRLRVGFEGEGAGRRAGAGLGAGASSSMLVQLPSAVAYVVLLSTDESDE